MQLNTKDQKPYANYGTENVRIRWAYVAVDINHVDPVVIGKDWFDIAPCERYVNCGNPECNRRILRFLVKQDKYLRGLYYGMPCSLSQPLHVQEHNLLLKKSLPA